MLSDKVKAVTKAVGIEPCSGCQKRAAMLDEWQRRGFLRSGALALFGLKNLTLKLAWQAVGKAIPVTLREALSLVQMINTVQPVWHTNHEKHASREEALTTILTHLEHFKPGTVGYTWLSRMTPLADEVLPGWILDYAPISQGYPRRVLPDNAEWVVNDGYRLVLKGEKYSLISDEAGVIYQAKTPTQAPPAAELARASDFPGAVAYNLFREPESAWNRLRRLLTPVTVVYAQTCCDRIDCVIDGCIYGDCKGCVDHCCVGVACSSAPPAGCQFNAGCESCPWIYSVCMARNCNCCVARFWPGGCCMPNICCFTCRFCNPC